MSRYVIEQIQATSTSDGAGVNLQRVFGGDRTERFDPFLMLDEFVSDNASDYIAGFPSHPHRGFQTITYMLHGKMEHRDHMENIGLISDGGVQWMTAGKGVIHSEMPQQTAGLMHGFQVWLNLPAKHKLMAANYEDVTADNIPVFQGDSYYVKAIAGEFSINHQLMKGYFDTPDTQAVYLDVHIPADKQLSLLIDDQKNVLIYCYDGVVAIGEKSINTPEKTLARLAGDGEILIANHTDKSARMIILAGLPIREPIAQYGPFVMNSMAEVQQAILDYQAGMLTD